MNAERLATYFGYLDTLRETGITNMFSAAPYLASAHGLSREAARNALSLWMQTFDGEKTPEERAVVASQQPAA